MPDHVVPFARRLHERVEVIAALTPWKSFTLTRMVTRTDMVASFGAGRKTPRMELE